MNLTQIGIDLSGFIFNAEYISLIEMSFIPINERIIIYEEYLSFEKLRFI